MFYPPQSIIDDLGIDAITDVYKSILKVMICGKIFLLKENDRFGMRRGYYVYDNNVLNFNPNGPAIIENDKAYFIIDTYCIVSCSEYVQDPSCRATDERKIELLLKYS